MIYWLLLAALFLLALLLIWLLILVRPGKRKAVPSQLLTDYAHRGLHDDRVPENSLAAFRQAAENGYGIELDLQLSADREVMVFHDYTLERMTGEKGKLSECTAGSLRAMHLLNKDGSITEQTIPTLREVLDTVDGRVPLLIELKGESTDTALCPAADEILRQYTGAYCVESFNPMLLAWYKQNRCDICRGQLYTDVYREKGKSVLNLLLSAMALNVLSRPHFIAYNFKYRNKIPVRTASGLFGAHRFIWTVRSEAERGRANENMIFENIQP
ncbi:MAG: glycerophosphodiester phosphodiesterase [Clostridia bacterium]|nr:glycerophosphodiester phosphodiesterase [Clostridia bacterium]